jgi:hypothetical protein
MWSDAECPYEILCGNFASAVNGLLDTFRFPAVLLLMFALLLNRRGSSEQ